MVEGDVDALLSTVAATAPALGWGVWEFKRTSQRLSLDVHNSPFIAFDRLDSAPCCAPILGMFTALAEIVLDQAAAQELNCASGGAASCSFIAERVAS